MLQANTSQPLSGRSVALDDGELRELPCCGKLVLRCDSEDAATLAAINRCGITLPTQANTCHTFARGRVIWMGPDEWLLHSDRDPAASEWTNFTDSLAENLQGFHSAQVDVSDYYTLLQLTSSNASAILARSCPLDLIDVATKENGCAQTRLGNAAVLLLPIESQRISDKKTADPTNIAGWTIQVRWSYADYVWKMLERSAISFSL